ncbi:MAG: hypothetical protein IKN15_06890 [Bacteroidaceae bacterium]|nr:hypothetical protein [Bacteroidaceae bacterium]
MTKKNNPYEGFLNDLRNSTMFHMSLGSKELFHSNFLHWISIVNWDAFLQIMHDLAGLEKDEVFWWEETNCDVEGYKGKYCPDNNNIEVRREYNHFDLSIYILDSEKKSKKKSQTEENEKFDSEGNILTRKWIPVLILENKMKSLPYEEQLERYTKDAFDEWRTGKNQDVEFKDAKNKCGTEKSIAWNTNYGINFILLSLIDNNSELGKEVKPIFYYYNKSVDISFKWIHKSYDDLKNNLERTLHYEGFKEGLNKSIVEDYHKFIKALYNLASNCWEIDLDKSYRYQIFPWDINDKDAKAKRNEIEKYKKLRIHDIHEKLLYDQLLSMLEQELKQVLNNKNRPFCRYSKELIQAQKDKIDELERTRLFTNLSYAHGVGIFEVQYILSKDFKPIGTNDKELFKLIIQVQGDRYCHMVVYDNIVKEEKDINGKKLLSVNLDVLTPAWKDNLKDKQDTLAQYISIKNSKPTFPWATVANWGQYGDNLIYQYVKIPPSATIQEVIDAIVNDINKITEWFK